MAFVYTWWAVFSPEERRKEEAAWHHDNVKISSSLSFKGYELLGGKQRVATSVFPSDFIFLSLGKEGWKDLVFMPNKLMFCYTGLEEAVVSLQQPENSTANDPQTKRFRIARLADRLRSFPTLRGLGNKLFQHGDVPLARELFAMLIACRAFLARSPSQTHTGILFVHARFCMTTQEACGCITVEVVIT